MNFDTALKNLAFRIGSEIANIAKTKTAPIKTGNLKKDISVISVYKNSVLIGNTQKAKYAKFVHFGTKSHIIKAKNKKVLASNGRIFGKKVNHPGIKANPYLENAYNEYKNIGLNRALNDFANEVGKIIANDIEVSFK